jgi:UDP-GlcNAc3NAcA epimerase
MSASVILSVVGARPQFIKAAVVSRAIAAHNRAHSDAVLDEVLVHTGQHYDRLLSAVFFEQMDVSPPAVNLAVGSGSHGATTGAMLTGLEREIVARQPSWVVVYGDTNSTLAGALAAAKLHVPLAHVEAGLRSFNRRMPEEINRVVTDHVADLLFCPSAAAADLLAREGITDGVHVVGDVMLDAVRHYRAKAVAPERSGPFALASLHRAENTDDPRRLRRILGALARAPVPVVLPLHPRTRKAIAAEGISVEGQLQTVEPLPYFAMLGHLERCAFVITDSGGLQKEAYFFGKKCVTVRDETEWTELVEAGANRVVGTDPEAILAACDWALDPLTGPQPLYGDGHAGQRIVERLAAPRR